MISIVGNRINGGSPQDWDMDYPKPHLVMKDNPRPKCALVIGDGFTQGYLRHYDLHKEIPCSIHDIIPAPNGIFYIPTKGDTFTNSKFFTKEKWPKIYKEFSDGLSGWDFFKEVSKERINPKYENGRWSLNNDTIGYELRCYLWHYFRFTHKKLWDLRNHQNNPKPYPWYNILKHILENYFLQIISFNYDSIFMRIIYETAYLYPPSQYNPKMYGKFNFPVEMSYDFYMNYYDINAMPLCYIHGSWINQIYFQWPQFLMNFKNVKIEGNIIDVNNTTPSILGFSPNPWIENQIEFINNYFSTVYSTCNLNPQEFPMFPDIVPPGFQGHDKYNPYSKVTETSRRILNEADLVIICGLSGNEPDTEEVNDLLSNINKNIDVIHVGLDQDKDYPVAQTLKKMKNVKWLFFDATTELSKVDEYLKDKFLNNHHSKRNLLRRLYYNFSSIFSPSS